ADFLVAVDAEERSEGRSAQTLVRVASAIDPAWLIDLFADAVREQTEARWNAEAERVEVTQRLLYDKLVIDESRSENTSDESVARVLSEAALALGPRAVSEKDELDRWMARVNFVAERFPESGIAPCTEDDLRSALVELCQGNRS